MADSRLITRRTLLKASPAIALISTAVLAPEVIAAEAPNDKVRRLQRELSDALAELMSAPLAPADFVSVVYPSGTTKHARTLFERDLYETNLGRELERTIAIEQWRPKYNALKSALDPFDRTRWEFAQLDENEARNAMLRTFLAL